MHLTEASSPIEYDQLFELLRNGQIDCIDTEYYKKHFTVSQAIQLYAYENRCRNGGFRKHELYEKYRGSESWDKYGRYYRLQLQKLKIAALNKGKQVLGGLARQSAALRAALKRVMTFYHISGESIVIQPQQSAADVYKKLQSVVYTGGVVQGLQRMIRTGRGSFMGWTFEKPIEEKHIVVTTKDEWKKPIREAKVITRDELQNEFKGKYACAVSGELKELSPKTVLSPATKPIKGGRTLVACLEKVMVLKKGLETIVVYGAKNLSVVAREAEISLAALRHLVYQRSKTANGWSLLVCS